MSHELKPGLLVAHSDRLENLTDVATTLMRNYPLAPLEEETVLVQSNGIAQWLKIELAKASGIASMLNVTLPARFVWKAYRTILGDDIPKTSPFDKDRLSWRIMRVLPLMLAGENAAQFDALAKYLGTTNGGEPDQRKLFQLSERIADLFDQYQNYRADWLDAWTKGQFHLDSEAEPVDSENQWQPLLWKALVHDIGEALYWTNRAELHHRFVEKAKSLTAPPEGLPKRIVVFGISSLPQQTLEVLDAMKGFTQIALCVHNPCKHYWANIVDGKEALKVALKDAKRRHKLKANMQEDIDDDELHLHAQPLLAAWGKQGRDYIHLLDLYDETQEKEADFPALKFEVFSEESPQNLLQQLQNDILELRPITETRQTWQPIKTIDKSISFHICHSIQREIEVLHDQLLAAFEENPELRPRDVMVMVPDVNAYAPHIDAVFGRFAFGDQDKRRIPYTLADQGQRHQQPMLVALEALLTIEQSRVTQADVLGLLGVPAIQQRFGFQAQEIQELTQWIKGSGARWGLEAEQRTRFGMPAGESTNSWWFALERMIFGYATGRPESDQQVRWQTIEPYHEVAGLSANAVGKLGLLISKLNAWWTFSAEQRSLPEWARVGEEILDGFFKASDDEELILLGKVRSVLADLLDVVAESEFESLVELNIFKESWLSRIDQPSLNQRFLVGSVNFATLMPMRAIPFKHIYVLGMDDKSYPRRQSSMDFDLMQASYRPGDRSRRDDDRYLFLEALLSARERFYISWVGRSARDNSEWPSSVLVAQLRDHLVNGWCPEAEAPEEFLERFTTEHKLQAFNSAYFGADSDASLFTYSSEWYETNTGNESAQEALRSWQPEDGQKLRIRIKDLVSFMRQPAEPFFTKRLNTYFRTEEVDTQDSETFAFDGLESWQQRSELIDIGVSWLKEEIAKAGSCPQVDSFEPLEALFHEHLNRKEREGALGISPFSQVLRKTLVSDVNTPLVAAAACLENATSSVADMALSLEVQQLLFEDTVQNMFQTSTGEVLQLLVSASSAKPKHKFEPYLRHLVATMAARRQPGLGRVTTTVLFKPGSGKTEPDVVTFAPLDAGKAREVFAALLGAYEQALSSPTAMVGEYAMTWLETYCTKISGHQRAQPISAEEASQKAFAEVGKAILDSDNLAAEHPYAFRINHDFESYVNSAEFTDAMLNFYAPLVRLTEGQAPINELPVPKAGSKGEKAQGAEA